MELRYSDKNAVSGLLRFYQRRERRGFSSSILDAMSFMCISIPEKGGRRRRIGLAVAAMVVADKNQFGNARVTRILEEKKEERKKN